ncbi:NADPH-dependent FMN reductase [Methylibium sp.]|uniref:NADPH-dependent FMN reductase n=1 Tax=Methylibium sp. TaxID=2067992 RepID=UPI003D12D149
MAGLRVLLIPGSVRTGSWNLKLAAAAAAALRELGAEPTVADLRALALPVYDADLEAAQGVPPGAATLAQQMATHDAFVVVSPEYNAFPTPLLINTIDWVSRLPEGMKAMNGKPTALLSASPGALGGLRSLLVLRNFLSLNPAMLVLPQQFALSHAAQAFTADGALADEKQAKTLDGVLAALLKTAGTLRG